MRYSDKPSKTARIAQKNRKFAKTAQNSAEMTPQKPPAQQKNKKNFNTKLLKIT